MTRRLTFCFRRLQESQARAVLCRLSSGTLGRVMRGDVCSVRPTARWADKQAGRQADRQTEADEDTDGNLCETGGNLPLL
ncbi:hypothetical protein V8C44DRAFT_315912 [Trichoderma aethiopicum]